MKKINLLFIVVGGFLALFLLSMYAVDENKLYTEFIKSAKIEVTNPDKVRFKVNKFPYLSLVIDEVTQAGKVELKEVEIRFSLLSALKFDYKVSDIKIGQLSLHLSNDDVNFLEHDEFIGELIQKEALHLSANVKKLIFIESDNDIPLIIENFVFQGSSNSSNFIGEVKQLGNLKGDFTRDAEKVGFNLNISGSGYNITLQEDYHQAALKSGKLSITTNRLVENLTRLLPDFKLSDKLEPDEEVKINCDIEPSDKLLLLKNIIISSKSIEGKGEALLSKKPQEASEIKINFSKIDLESWIKNKDVSNKKRDVSSGVMNKNSGFTKRKIKTNITAEQVKMSQDNTLSAVKLSSLAQDGKITVDDFSAVINQNGQFKVTGVLSQNSFRTIFKGQIALAHEDLNDLVEFIGEKDLRSQNKIPYSLISDIKFSSVDISLQNLLIKTNDTQIFGTASTKFIGNSPRTSANLKFTKINLDDKNFPVLTQLYGYGMGLTSDSKKEDYLNKFIPLRKISAISNYDLAFDQITLNSTSYRNVGFNLGLSPGRIRLENLTLTDSKNYIDASLDLVASGVKPTFNITIHEGRVSTEFLSPKGLLELRKNLLENIALDKIDLNMNLNLSKVYQNEFELGRVVFKAKNKNTLLEINNFDADLLGGRLTSSGSILLDPYTLNFVYALNSASMNEISKTLPDGMINGEGFVSLNGMWSTNGNSLEEQLYNLYTKSNILAKDIIVSNFSIDEMIETLNTPKYDSKNLKDDIKKALLTGKTEISEIKTPIELSKGVFSVGQTDLKTKYSTGALSANINLYDFSISLSSIFSFYVNKTSPGKNYADRNTTNLTVNASGNLFNPKKEADSKTLEELLNPNVKK